MSVMECHLLRKEYIVIAVRQLDIQRIITIVSDSLILLPVSYPSSAEPKQFMAMRIASDTSQAKNSSGWWRMSEYLPVAACGGYQHTYLPIAALENIRIFAHSDWWRQNICP